jgi:alkylation response protein AidB-like acyl-CoA dehydrogenase
VARAIAAAERTVALAMPSAPCAVLLIDPADAPDLVLLVAPEGPVLHDAAALADRRPLDGGQWNLPLETARLAGAGRAAGPALAVHARLLIAAQLAGIAAGARDMAVDYAKLREQFGRPIGSFQAVKHHCADMATRAMAAADLLSFAAVALAQRRVDAGFQAGSALSVAMRAAVANAAANVQVHGGIGFSDEADAHLFVKHAHVWEAIAGGREAVHAMLLGEAFPLRPAAPRRH